MVHPDRGVVRPAQQVVAGLQRDLADPPDEPVLERAGRRPLRGLRLRPGAAAEGVAEAGHGPQEPRLVGLVLQRLAQLVDEDGQVHLGHERVGPQPVVDLCLGDGVRPALHEQLEQLERLGRQVDRVAAQVELPGLVVEHETAESHAHGWGSPRNTTPTAADFNEKRSSKGFPIADGIDEAADAVLAMARNGLSPSAHAKRGRRR